MNITDVGHLTDDTFDRGEDKMLVSARLENKSTEEIAAFYTDAFMTDIRKVNIAPAREYPRATAYVPQMIGLIQRLIAMGHAYEIEGTVYFDIATFALYGKLSRNRTATCSRARAANRTRARSIQATSRSGRRPGSTGCRRGRVRGAWGSPAGTSSARRCRSPCSASDSTFTPAAPTTSSPTTRPRSRSPRP